MRLAQKLKDKLKLENDGSGSDSDSGSDSCSEVDAGPLDRCPCLQPAPSQSR